MRSLLILFTLLMTFTSCKKEDCQTCTKTIGGVAGNTTDEVREVCDAKEARALEDSSAGTTTWKCE